MRDVSPIPRGTLWAAILALACSCLWLNACAPHSETAVLPRLFRDAGVWTFRHKLKLEFPDRNFSQSFDGLMRLDSRTKTAHVAGIAGLGMQMFDMTVTEESATAAYLHPMLAKMPGAREHMARCIRRVWFDSLLVVPQTLAAERETWTLETSGGTEADLWPKTIRYTDTRMPYTLTIRLLQAQQEETP